jgi:hypothetical protein
MVMTVQTEAIIPSTSKTLDQNIIWNISISIAGSQAGQSRQLGNDVIVRLNGNMLNNNQFAALLQLADAIFAALCRGRAWWIETLR